MVKIYNIHYYNDVESEYVAYYKNNTHIYLVSIELHDSPRFIRIKTSQYHEKLIYDYEEYYTYTYGFDNTRVYEEL
jgi:hypothetical protein